MKIISWDIGINNLAYCILHKETCKILGWRVIDILQSIRENYLCQGFKKNGTICNNNASYYLNNQYFCKTHKIPDVLEIKSRKFCSCYAKNGNKCKKKSLFYSNYKYFCKSHKNQAEGTITDYVTVDNISFYNKSRLMITELDKISELLDIDEILIENQPVKKNPIMKSVQIILYSYYLLKTDKVISLIGANRKMTIYDGPQIECNKKTKYAKNKFLAIEYCKYFLENDKNNLDLFLSHKKKDDLADAYLQGLQYIKPEYDKIKETEIHIYVDIDL